HRANLGLDPRPDLDGDVAGRARLREQAGTTTATTDEPFLLAPRVVRDGRDAELLLHVVRRQVLLLRGRQDLGALLRRVRRSRSFRKAASGGVGGSVQGEHSVTRRVSGIGEYCHPGNVVL